MDPEKIASELDRIWQSGGTEEDMASYLQQQGMTPEQWQETWSAHQDEGKPSRIGTALSQAAEGATFGFLNEILDPLLPGQPVGDYLRAGEEAYPVMSLASDLAGGIASGGGLMKLGMKGGGLLARSAKPFTPSALGGVRGVAQNALRAGAVGAVEGAGRGEDNRALGAAMGGVGGMVASPVLQGVGRLAGAATRGARNLLTPTPTPDAADAQRGMRSLLEIVERGPYGQSSDPLAVMRTAANETLQGAGNIAPLTPPAVYMGDTGQGVAVGVAQGGMRELAERQSRGAIQELGGTVDKPGQLLQSLARAAGLDEAPSGRVISHAADMFEQTKKVAQDAYDGIFARNQAPQNAERIPALVDFMRRNSRRMSDAVRYASETFEGDPDLMNLPRVVGGDTLDEWAEGMTLNQAHRIRQGLSRAEERAIMQGDMKAARELTRLRNEYASYIDDIFPEYGPARAQIADAHELSRAFDLGAQIVRRGERSIDEERAVRGLLKDKGSEQAKMFVLGAVNDIVEDLAGRANARNTSNIAGRLQRRQEVLDRVTRLFPDNESIQRFVGELNAAFEIGAQPQRLVGGSQTMRNQEAVDKVREAVGTLIQGLYNPSYGVLNLVGRGVREGGREAVASANRGLANIMFGDQFVGPKGANQLFDELAAVRAAKQARTRADQMMQGGSSLLGGLLGGRAGGLLNR